MTTRKAFDIVVMAKDISVAETSLLGIGIVEALYKFNVNLK